jgi:hypothetical protein
MIASTPLGSPLFAEVGRFLPLLYLAAALIIGAVVIVLVGRWRKSSATLGPSASDELAQYRALYEQGAISEEEYRKLRSLLGGEMRKNLDVPGKAPAPAADKVQPSPPPPAADEPPPATGIRPPE